MTDRIEARVPALSAMLVVGLALGLLAGQAKAAPVVRPVVSMLDGIRFRSVLVYDDAQSGRRPGLVMVPNWYGVNDDAIAKATMIAETDGAVVLLTDVYGEAIRPTSDEAARTAMSPLLADRATLRRRMADAIARLRAMAASGAAPVDPARLAAIGFCFGGAAVLELARSGSDVKAVVSFHGELGTPDPNDARRIRARVLAMNGADDALTSPDFGPFVAEMRQSPAPWSFVVIGHAVHCFTERSASPGSGICRYDQAAAAQSYGLMRNWLAASFGPS